METIQLGTPQPTTTSNQFRIDMPSSIGQGGVDIIAFSSGLQFIVLDIHFERPLQIRNFSSTPTVGFGFCLTGRFEVRPACLKTALAIRTGESGFFAFPRSVEVFEKVGNENLKTMYLMLNGDSLMDIANGDEDRFYPVLNSLEKKVPCRISHGMTPVMKAILHQMHRCPYRGITRQVFLEGKAMELLAHKLEQIYPGGDSHGVPIKASETERVRHAAHILARDLENPPDITALAHSVGLNRTKLYRSFKRIFGLFPFEYLRNHRLQTAMQLLQDSEINVTEAAMMVGYTNLSYFAKAFKSMFGITPGELRKSFPRSTQA